MFQKPAQYYISPRYFATSETFPQTELSSSSGAPPDDGFFAPPDVTFASLGVQSPVLLQRLEKGMGLVRPTAVQAAAFSKIALGNNDVTIGAETGSGKTLAYLLPLMDDILQRKKRRNSSAVAVEEKGDGFDDHSSYHFARAMILVPNKELVQQVVRMALALAGGAKALIYGSHNLKDTTLLKQQQRDRTEDETDIVRIAIMPGGLKKPQDFQPFRKSITGLGGKDQPVDLVITTPAAVGPMGLSPSNIDMFADIETLVVDESDMLLDGGYLRPLNNVLMGFRRADRLDTDLGVKKTQHVFVAATLPDFGLRSVDAYLKKKFPRANQITMAGMHNARHYGLNEKTIWIENDSKKERMLRLVDMLKTPRGEGGLEGEKVMVFLNSVDDVEAASEALVRAGVSALPFHAKINLEERSSNLDRFRRYRNADKEDDDDTIPLLVCTDLASRGLDIPGVNAIVQLQFAGNVVAHLHRMGRCGRAGFRTGRGVVFYGEKERELVDVVREAEDQQERMVLEGDVEELSPEKDTETDPRGNVKKAFSRKRGFTKKRKKERRRSVDRSDI